MKDFSGSYAIDLSVSRRFTCGVVPLFFIFPNDHPSAGDPILIVHAKDFWRSREGEERKRFEDILKGAVSGKQHPIIQETTHTLGCGTQGRYYYCELPDLEAAVGS